MQTRLFLILTQILAAQFSTAAFSRARLSTLLRLQTATTMNGAIHPPHLAGHAALGLKAIHNSGAGGAGWQQPQQSRGWVPATNNSLHHPAEPDVGSNFYSRPPGSPVPGLEHLFSASDPHKHTEPHPHYHPPAQQRAWNGNHAGSEEVGMHPGRHSMATKSSDR